MKHESSTTHHAHAIPQLGTIHFGQLEHFKWIGTDCLMIHHVRSRAMFGETKTCSMHVLVIPVKCASVSAYKPQRQREEHDNVVLWKV